MENLIFGFVFMFLCLNIRVTKVEDYFRYQKVEAEIRVTKHNQIYEKVQVSPPVSPPKAQSDIGTSVAPRCRRTLSRDKKGREHLLIIGSCQESGGVLSPSRGFRV